MTTTYIDGLFEQVYDSATGDLTYRHYILAGGARVGVETIAASAGGNISSDTLGFYVRDEVGSVIATVTEKLGGAKQKIALMGDVHGCTSAAGGRMPGAAYGGLGQGAPRHWHQRLPGPVAVGGHSLDRLGNSGGCLV